MAVWPALAAILIIAGVVLVVETRGTTFNADEWVWILNRRGSSVGTFLRPHNGHFSLVPLVIYKLLFAIEGLRSYVAYRALIVVVDVAVAALVFVYVRRRVGDFPALVATALIAFFGPGWQDILWPFQNAWLIAIGAGVGALLALERRDRAGDVAASLLLAVSLASTGFGIAVAVGVTIDVLFNAGWRRRAWIVVVPLALFAIWWVAYQNAGAATQGIYDVPGIAANFLAATASGLVGLTGQTISPAGAGTMLVYGPPVLALMLVAAVWRLHRLGRISTRIVALAAIVLSFAVLLGVQRTGISKGYDSRYLYVGAVFSILLAAELAAGVNLSVALRAILGILAVIVIVSNLGVLRQAGAYLRTQASEVSADLAALNIARPDVAPQYVATSFPGWPFIALRAGPYFAAQASLGSPAATPAQLVTEPEAARETADSELIGIHRVALQSVSAAAGIGARPPRPTPGAALGGTVTGQGSCLRFTAGGFSSALTPHALLLALPPAGVTITASGGPAAIGVRRFAATFHTVGSVTGSASLRIGGDLSSVPWQLQVTTADRVAICGL